MARPFVFSGTRRLCPLLEAGMSSELARRDRIFLSAKTHDRDARPKSECALKSGHGIRIQYHVVSMGAFYGASPFAGCAIDLASAIGAPLFGSYLTSGTRRRPISLPIALNSRSGILNPLVRIALTSGAGCRPSTFMGVIREFGYSRPCIGRGVNRRFETSPY